MKHVICCLLLASAAFAQESKHRFFDKTNKALFTGVAISRALDLESTWRFRRAGWQEVELSNGFVDNKPAFTAFSGGIVLAHVGGCYLLHRTNHHKIERVVSAIHIAAVSATVVSNYRLAGR